jgi:hypothetical protein
VDCPPESVGFYRTTLLSSFGIVVTVAGTVASPCNGSINQALPIPQCCSNPGAAACNIDDCGLVTFTSTLGCVITSAAAKLGGTGTVNCVNPYSTVGSFPTATAVTFEKTTTANKWNEFHLCVQCP